ncbi:MAG TPA: WhiB family transcriptional regulator [Pseudonocardiaceae bacterium]|jgi:WhiB family redox-sensing transcriptional regulator
MRGPTTWHSESLTSVRDLLTVDPRGLQSRVDNAEQRRCRGADPDDFFPADGARFLGPEALDAERARVAGLCHGCPVRRECLAAALTRDELYGSWGGITQPDYQMIRRLRREQLAAERNAA